jgi:hypothetical protein
MQNVAVFYSKGRCVFINTQMTYLEIMVALAKHGVEESPWFHFRSRVKGFLVASNIPNITVRAQGIVACPDDVVELWWNDGILDQYRLSDFVAMYTETMENGIHQ